MRSDAGRAAGLFLDDGKLRRPVPSPPAVIASAVLIAAVIGFGIAWEPGLALPFLGGLLAVLAALLAPAHAAMLLVLPAAVGFQYVFPEVAPGGMELQALHKLAMVALLVPVLLRYGIVWYRLLPLAALALAFLVTMLWGDPHLIMSPGEAGKALIGLAAPLLLLPVRWPRRQAGQLLGLLLFLPLVSLAAGTLLHAAGLYPVYMMEFTGAFRLQGANIPAHLAFLAFTAFAAAIMLWRRWPQYSLFLYTMMGTNFLILLLTGTRGPLLAAVPLVLVFLGDLVRRLARGRSGLIVPLVVITGLISTAAVWQLDNLRKRSFTRTGEAGIDLSGREEAWRFFLDKAGESPWFGRGLGAVLEANDGTLYTGFAVPHNEYIRFYYDTGLIGVTLLFVALLTVLLFWARRLAGSGQLYGLAFAFGFLLYSFTDNTLSTLQFTVPFCLIISALGAVDSADAPVGGVRRRTSGFGRKEAVHGSY